MHRDQPPLPPRYRPVGRQHLDRVPQFASLSRDQLSAIKVVSTVLPFRVNQYVVDELIDWQDIPNDPIFQLTFPQAGMLEPADFAHLHDLLRRGDRDLLQHTAHRIQLRLKPHPSGQFDLNVPIADGEKLAGAQHKYRETLLFFPSQGQTCHAYCTYCFRWPQFVGIEGLKFANREIDTLVAYLEAHPEVTDVLFTGGDPMIMSARVLRRYIEPLLDPAFEHLQSIRIGSKALAYWPYRFLTDHDADDLLELFEEVRARGRQLAFMAHFSHPRELETAACEKAIRRLRDAGCTIRCQAPIIRHVNDKAETWAAMWRAQVRLGAVPYYLFIARETGPKKYFEVPLARAFKIFSGAFSQVSGLARTVRGPSMSTSPGKVVVEGVTEIHGERTFVLKMIQGRDPEWAGRVFFAQFDSQAAWLSDLKPFFGEAGFFFSETMRQMERGRWRPDWQVDDLETEEDSA